MWPICVGSLPSRPRPDPLRFAGTVRLGNIGGVGVMRHVQEFAVGRGVGFSNCVDVDCGRSLDPATGVVGVPSAPHNVTAAITAGSGIEWHCKRRSSGY